MTDPEGVAESQAEYTGLPETDEAISAAFGATNRRRLLGSYFKGGSVTAANAWEHVYRLLLWTDQTTGLAHCYESDKSQPGKPWYARSLAFHDWLARALNATPAKLGEEIDWMFQRAAKELAAHVLRSAGAVATLAGKQRKMYEGREFPSPGTDPELIAIVRETLGEHLTEPPPAVWSQLVERVRRYFALDYKRKNLLGEGFEDVLGEVITQSCSGPKAPKVYVRELLNVLGGFSNQKVGAKVSLRLAPNCRGSRLLWDTRSCPVHRMLPSQEPRRANSLQVQTLHSGSEEEEVSRDERSETRFSWSSLGESQRSIMEVFRLWLERPFRNRSPSNLHASRPVVTVS